MSAGPEYRVPPADRTLGRLAIWWMSHHLVIPEGDHAGEWFEPTLDHSVWLANWYELKPGAQLGEKAQAFRHRTGVWMAAQKVGKSPGVAAESCFGFVGPEVFGGWATHKHEYVCNIPGCDCDEDPFVYEAGDPMGIPWATPRIQLCAVAEDQVENTWGALVPMIDQGPLANLLTTGEAFIRHPSGNRDALIEKVTSSARARLGARISHGKCDETGLWTKTNGMAEFMRTLRRGAAGMGGRVSESTNPPDPAENSVAQQTIESKRPDVYKHHFPPPEGWSFQKKADRKKIFAWNYRSSPWVDQRDIEAEASALMEQGESSDAERFFGNRIKAGSDTWMDIAKWKAREQQLVVRPRTTVALGFDGSDNDDFTGIRLETLDFHQFTPTYGPADRPTQWDPADWNGRIPRAEVMSAFRELATEFEIVRAYLDPFFWESEADHLAAEFGDKVFIKWPTNRLVPMWRSLERMRTDVYNPESGFTHDADEQVMTHMRNAVTRARGVDTSTNPPTRRYILGKPNDHQKIDYVMSSVLAHEAASDAVASGKGSTEPEYVYI